MSNYSLTACSFWIRKKNITKSKGMEIYMLNSPLNSDEKVYNDVFSLIKEFCEKSKEYTDDEQGQKVFKVLNDNIVIEEDENIKYTYIEIESGSYGINSNIINKVTKEIIYVRKKDDAETFRFRILFAVPKDENTQKGIILFQNEGQFGVKSLISDFFHKFVSDTINGYTEIGNICPEKVVEKLLENDNVKKIIYIRNNISNDDSDIENKGYGKEERVITKFFDTTWVKSLISSYLHGNNRVYEFENKKYDDFRVVCDVYGKERKFSVNNIDKMSIIEGIPNSILNKNNDIDDEKLKEHFVNVANEYLQHMAYRFE